jgi:hypothetical protein
MPLAGGEPSVNEREFLGRKIYSLALAPLDGPDDPKGASASRTFNFATGGGYAALSGDSGLIEEYLRSNERSANALRDLPGLLEAAQKVGGMGAGLFGYQNQAETIRLWLESSKKENAALDKLLAMSPLAGGKAINAEERKNLTDWLGLSLLPPFEQISKYFHFLVYSLSSSEAGVSWKLYLPAPPRLK